MELNHGLIHQIYSLPELIRRQYADLEPKARSVLDTPEIFSIQRIVLTGCGDSYAAGLSVRDTFAELTGLPVDVMPAIELSRTAHQSIFGFAPNNPLVIAVSNSGSVVRMNEAIQRAAQYGAFTLAVTGNRKSELARVSSRIFDLSIPPFEAAPGTRSYVVSLMSLLLLAIRIGEVRGKFTMDHAMDRRNDMLRQADELEQSLPEIDRQMKLLAASWDRMDGFDFVGTGMEFGTAWYCHAKVLEQLGKYASYKNSEDWLHTNLFLRNTEKTAVIVFADQRNPADSRTKELIHYAVKLHRPVVVIGGEKMDVQQINVPVSAYYSNSCLTQFAPVSILLNYIADLIGEKDGRGCEGVWKIAEGAGCIRNSKVEII